MIKKWTILLLDADSGHLHGTGIKVGRRRAVRVVKQWPKTERIIPITCNVVAAEILRSNWVPNPKHFDALASNAACWGIAFVDARDGRVDLANLSLSRSEANHFAENWRADRQGSVAIPIYVACA